VLDVLLTLGVLVDTGTLVAGLALARAGEVELTPGICDKLIKLILYTPPLFILKFIKTFLKSKKIYLLQFPSPLLINKNALIYKIAYFIKFCGSYFFTLFSIPDTLMFIDSDTLLCLTLCRMNIQCISI
jgi:hypothetical protein